MIDANSWLDQQAMFCFIFSYSWNISEVKVHNVNKPIFFPFFPQCKSILNFFIPACGQFRIQEGTNTAGCGFVT